MKKNYLLVLFLNSITKFKSKFNYALFIMALLIGTSQIFAITESSKKYLNEIINTGNGSEINSNISNLPTSIPAANAKGGDEEKSCTTCITVNSGVDDAENFEGGNMFLDSSDLELVHDADYPTGGFRGNQTIGIRFNSVDIPQGATITSAYVQFTVDETVSDTEEANGGINVDPCNLTIYGEASDNAAAFTTQTNNIVLREKTNASVSWNPPLWSTPGERSADQETVDISSIIQEIVNRTGYSINNSVAIIFTGTGRRTAVSYDGSPSQAPQLCIEYSATDCDNVPEPPNEVCDKNTDIGGTTGFIDLSDANNGSYQLVDTVVTYEFEEVDGENIEAVNLNGPGEQGPVFKFTEGVPGSSGSINATFSIPINGPKFKLTDFDFDEVATVNVYDENNKLIDLGSGSYVTVGSQISQLGNVFTEINSGNNVDGDLITFDPIGSVIFDFNGINVSRIDVTIEHPSASSIRYSQIDYCNENPVGNPCVFEDLSDYNLIAERFIYLKNRNKVYADAGVGIIENYGRAKVLYNSHVEGFVQSPRINVYYNSSVGSKIYSTIDNQLPEFVYNTISNDNSQDIVVNNGQTITLDGYDYDNILVKGGATVKFTQPNVFIDRLVTRYGSNVEFAQSANLFVNKKVILGRNSSFNRIGNYSVVMYTKDDVEVRIGSDVDANIYSLENIAAYGRRYNHTNMNGLFIGKKIFGLNSVKWRQGVNCPTAEIVIPGQNTAVAARKGPNKKETNIIATKVDKSILHVDFGVKAWPNPSTDDFNIKVTTNNTVDKVNIQVMDVTGKQVHSGELDASRTYNFGEALQSGIYFIKVNQPDNSRTIKVIKR